ncbi:MAG: FxsA family protein [Halodesulfurarchaeum sp.]
MLRWLLVGLLLIPLADLALLVVVAGYIGWVPTVAIVVLTALLGMLFVRAEGRHTLARMQRSLRSGDLPTDELLDGGLLIAAGAFLLTPGLVTDAVGFLLALPVTRIPFRMALKRFLIVPMLDSETGGFATGKVYTFGFPDDGPGGTQVGMGGMGETDRGSEDSYDLGQDAYDIEFEDEDDEGE